MRQKSHEAEWQEESKRIRTIPNAKGNITDGLFPNSFSAGIRRASPANALKDP